MRVARLMHVSHRLTKLATGLVAWEVAEDSRPQPAKGLTVAEDSRPQPTCVDLPRLIRLRPDRVRTDQEPVVFSLLFLLFEVDRRVPWHRAGSDDAS